MVYQLLIVVEKKKKKYTYPTQITEICAEMFKKLKSPLPTLLLES